MHSGAKMLFSPNSLKNWLHQPKPHKPSWATWQWVILTIFAEPHSNSKCNGWEYPLQFKQSLGSWLSKDKDVYWPFNIDPKTSDLYYCTSGPLQIFPKESIGQYS